MRWISRYFIPTLLTACVVVCGYFWLREEVTSRIYRNKLEIMAGEYAALADQYNHAVRQSAITELEVTESSVNVLIRTFDGQIQRVETPFDPKREIFVDYLVGDGRIWIRRIFDQATPPENALVIDPVWEVVDWKRGGLNYGKIIYRSLEPGIWSIQVSGNGALTLEPVEASRADQLQASPQIRSYEEIKIQLDREVQAIGLKDLWDYCRSGFCEKN
ncbi:MAG TPA: hypothetical protein VK995_02130 [Oceanipulchritudo sp.]|nr:hypothetical protein [Oceanipulchritudo sp.]